jgi:hypothetical protein
MFILVGCCFAGEEPREIAPKFIAVDKILFGQFQCSPMQPRPSMCRGTLVGARKNKNLRVFVLLVAVPSYC